MTAERWSRMYQILTAIEKMDNENNNTTVRAITEHLQIIDHNIDINIVNSSIRHYRKNGLIRRKHSPYKHPFEYELSKRGVEQINWLEEFAEEYILDLDA